MINLFGRPYRRIYKCLIPVRRPTMPVWTQEKTSFLKSHRHKLSELRLAEALGLPLLEVKNKLEDLEVDDHLVRRRARDPERSRLYSDFKQFYLSHRCPWSPPDPARIYGLCRKILYGEYSNWLTAADLLWQAKALLVRMFGEYDPSRYRGRLRQEDNFANLFAQKMRGRLHRLIRPTTDTGNRGRADKFPHMPGMGLVNEAAAKDRDWCGDLVGKLPGAYLTLDGEEYQAIIKTYWEDKTFTQIGRDLGMSDKTAKARHDDALTKLKGYFDANAD